MAAMASQQPKFKSEVFVPIHKDDQSFEQRQRGIWDDMHDRMEKRRREWEDEVERMRKDFFQLKPSEIRRGSSDNVLDSSTDSKDVFYDNKDGSKKFHVSFDVSQFAPEEIDVRSHHNKLVVHAKHEEKCVGRSICREFSRTVDVPKNVEPESLSCTLSNDGILQIEAPVIQGPEVKKISNTYVSTHIEPPPFGKATTTTSQIRTGPTFVETDGLRKFKISVEIGTDFNPEDVVVKTVDRKLVVQARHEVKAAGRTSLKEFSREFDLPENVDPNLVTASMSDDGQLIVEAPISGSAFSQGSYTGKPGSTKEPKITISFDK